MKIRRWVKFSTLIMFLIISSFVAGCGAKNIDVEQIQIDEKYTYIDVIINDESIKDKEYGSDLVGKLKDVFGRSFENVSVRTGYFTPKRGELLLLPIVLDVSEDNPEERGLHYDSLAGVKVLTTDYNKSYNFSSHGSYNPNLIDALATVPIAYVPVMLGVNPYAMIGISQAVKGLAIKCYNSVVSSSEFTHFANSTKLTKTLSADLAVNLKYSDQSSFLHNNTIDAAEKSTITATITNKGKGTAFDVRLTAESKNSHILS